VGVAGLEPTMAFIAAGKRIGLANKESLVTGGSMISQIPGAMALIYPIDSEHSAIWQCLVGERKANMQTGEEGSVKRLIITASGGPFRETPIEELSKATKDQALKHPNWSMGPRITIGSSTLANKALEVIEAWWLFKDYMYKPDMEKSIAVWVHPQSIVHSIVEFVDNSQKAQLGVPDMKLPIQYAITFPNRLANDNLPRLDLTGKSLTFSAPDLEKFKMLSLGYKALKTGGTAPAVLNGADEKVVEMFLEGKIRFTDMADLVEKALNSYKVVANPTTEQIIDADRWARKYVESEQEKLENTRLLRTLKATEK
jgi:1-deoxy-D-xylulose-5-phosphate reductoisomerase